MNKRDLKIIAEAKQKEFDRSKDYVLNQMSIIEAHLNPNSQSRGLDNAKWIIAQSIKEIQELHRSLIELRFNLLTAEERNALDD